MRPEEMPGGVWASAPLLEGRLRGRTSLLWMLSAWPLGLALRLLTGFSGWTSRVLVEGPGAAYAGPALYVHWHRYQPYLGIHHGQARRWLMVARDAYMQPIVVWSQLHGVRVIRGGTGDGGRAALAHMVERLRAGDSAFLAVDGPRGPALQVKRGCVEMARAAGVPIIPVGYACRRARFDARRWDHWLMMRPFDTVTVRYGEPLRIGPEETLARGARAGGGGPGPRLRQPPGAEAAHKKAARHPRGTPGHLGTSDSARTLRLGRWGGTCPMRRASRPTISIAAPWRLVHSRFGFFCRARAHRRRCAYTQADINAVWLRFTPHMHNALHACLLSWASRSRDVSGGWCARRAARPDAASPSPGRSTRRGG